MSLGPQSLLFPTKVKAASADMSFYFGLAHSGSLRSRLITYFDFVKPP